MTLDPGRGQKRSSNARCSRLAELGESKDEQQIIHVGTSGAGTNQIAQEIKVMIGIVV
jgi:hypothetical protein